METCERHLVRELMSVWEQERELNDWKPAATGLNFSPLNISESHVSRRCVLRWYRTKTDHASSQSWLCYRSVSLSIRVQMFWLSVTSQQPRAWFLSSAPPDTPDKYTISLCGAWSLLSVSLHNLHPLSFLFPSLSWMNSSFFLLILFTFALCHSAVSSLKPLRDVSWRINRPKNITGGRFNQSMFQTLDFSKCSNRRRAEQTDPSKDLQHLNLVLVWLSET